MDFNIEDLSLDELLALDDFECSCGKAHRQGVKKVLIEQGAIRSLSSVLRGLGCEKPYILSGEKAFAAAGEAVLSTLNEAGIDYRLKVISPSPVVPDERAVGSALMHFEQSSDCVLAVGSGVINDTGKIIAAATGRKYIIVATAPSMDGYASSSSSMERDNFKISVDSTFPDAVICDLDILCAAPQKMLSAGIGDMLAKYISLCEWKISHIINGEYFCPVVYSLMKKALHRCVQNAEGLKNRSPEAVKAVTEGLILGGIAMRYAGVSRPASGTEHYFSHIWDMRSLAFGTRAELHGIQCGIATLLTLKVYDFIKTITPDREKALKAVRDFSLDEWNGKLRSFIGPAAEVMIEQEKREKKYDPVSHGKRLSVILERWEEILAVIKELPKYEEVLSLMETIGAPVSPSELELSDEQVRTTFAMTKDIRDKYISSRLLWDLGYLNE